MNTTPTPQVPVPAPGLSRCTVLDLVPFGNTGPDTQFFALRLSRPQWEGWQSGQFVMLRPDNFGKELPWARPFSICHVTSQHLVCFFKLAGRGTERIARLRPGDSVDVWGPLGSAFAVEPDTPTLLLAGGMGIAPFVGYVHNHPQPWHVSMLFGHRDPVGCYPVDSINERIPVDILREQDPGDLDNLIFSMQERMADHAEQAGLVLACGPRPFLRTVRKFALELGVRTQISLENRMACGVGACLGCVCKTTDKWPEPERRNWPVQVCTRGPVFWADQIDLDNEQNRGAA